MQEVGKEVVFQQGCYSRERIWYSGHVRGIGGFPTRGWQDEELTVVTLDVIRPISTFEVREPES